MSKRAKITAAALFIIALMAGTILEPAAHAGNWKEATVDPDDSTIHCHDSGNDCHVGDAGDTEEARY